MLRLDSLISAAAASASEKTWTVLVLSRTKGILGVPVKAGQDRQWRSCNINNLLVATKV
jgi:hypothetical protein